MENEHSKQNTNESTNTTDVIASTTPTDIEMAAIPAKQDDPYLVAFEDHFDADNPKYRLSNRHQAITY